MDILVLGDPGGGNDIKFEILAIRTAIKSLEINAHLVPKMATNIGDHVGLRGCSQTKHRRHIAFSGPLFDESSDVPVIGPKIMTPLRDAMGFIDCDQPDGHGLEIPR